MRRGRAIAIGYLLFCVIYLGAAKFSIGEARVLVPTAIDRAIPFLPWTIAIYLSQFLFLFLALWYGEPRAFGAIAIATLVSATIFVVWPTTIARPHVVNPAFDALWLFDVPSNCFPSLHVALAMIAAAFWRKRFAIVWAMAIALSTLTTKQHYAIDVAGGFVVGAISIAASRRYLHGVARSIFGA